MNRFRVPDIVFILEISTGLSRERITRLRNEEANLGYEQTEFLEKVKAVFDSLKDPNLIRLNGDSDLDELSDEIWRIGCLIRWSRRHEDH